MADVLVGEIGNTHDGALLDGPNHGDIFFQLDGANLVAQLCIFSLRGLVVILQLLYLECTTDNTGIVADIVL